MSEDNLRGLESLLQTESFGRTHEHHAEIESTNEHLLEWSEQGAPHGALVTADVQTKGRGRQGRTWQAEARKSLLASVLLHASVREHVPTLSLAAAVAICRVLIRHGVPAEHKWPNDILIGQHKLAGILCETRSLSATDPMRVVIGFGLNVHQREFSPELHKIATSLALHGCEVSRTELLAEILKELEDTTAVLLEHGFGVLRDEYCARTAVLGRTVHLVERNLDTVVEDIDASGALVTNAGIRVVADEVMVKW